MIAANVNVKALSTYMGHSAIVLPGNEQEAARGRPADGDVCITPRC
jgi:hypothetical protein